MTSKITGSAKVAGQHGVSGFCLFPLRVRHSRCQDHAERALERFGSFLVRFFVKYRARLFIFSDFADGAAPVVRDRRITGRNVSKLPTVKKKWRAQSFVIRLGLEHFSSVIDDTEPAYSVCCLDACRIR